jgi:flagellar hook protein FlgE
VAKATDYTTTASSDNSDVFTGAGYKSASTKIADVETLVTEYNAALSVYAEADPKPTKSTSITQRDLLNFDTDNPLSGLEEGDEVYAYIDGVKYSVSFEDTDTEQTVMQKFADKISDTPGFKAYMVDTTSSDPYNPNPLAGADASGANPTGEIVIEGIVPGQSFRVTEFGWTNANESNRTTKGDLVTLREAVLGSGMGHIESVEKALAEAVSGKQMDVYDSDVIAFSPTAALNDYEYSVEIYDKDQEETITLPQSSALQFLNMTDLNAFVDAFNDPDHGGLPGSNNNPFPEYLKAYNFNGNLVIKTLDENYDVEFTGDLKGLTLAKEEQVYVFADATSGSGNAETIDFFGTTVNIDGGDTAEVIAAKIYSEKDAIISSWNSSQTNANMRQIEDFSLSDDKITVRFQRGTHDEAALTSRTITDDLAGIASSDAGAAGAAYDITLSAQGGGQDDLLGDANNSGREGAGAEFLQIKTTINQTASKGDLQLRLDTLGLTDNAFGEFEVDESGMVTMTQDGARFAIGQVAVARFTDNRGLEPVGDNLLMETTRSGTALFNIDNDKMAEIKGVTLELSTADLSESLVNLMVFQRAFEANAKSITTADTILNTLIQLKR